MYDDIECPYCGKGNEINHDDGLGLMRAVDRYSPGRAKLGTYASWWIKQGIFRAIKAKGLIHVPERNFGKIFIEEVSLGDMVHDEDFDGLDFDIPEDRPSPYDCIVEKEANEISRYFDGLSSREKEVLNKRFCNEMSLESIGAAYGLTKERIRQVEEQALTKLKRKPILAELISG